MGAIRFFKLFLIVQRKAQQAMPPRVTRLRSYKHSQLLFRSSEIAALNSARRISQRLCMRGGNKTNECE